MILSHPCCCHLPILRVILIACGRTWLIDWFPTLPKLSYMVNSGYQCTCVNDHICEIHPLATKVIVRAPRGQIRNSPIGKYTCILARPQDSALCKASPGHSGVPSKSTYNLSHPFMNSEWKNYRIRMLKPIIGFSRGAP